MSDKILIVDDEAEIADLIETYLQNENYSVYKFYSAQKAWECIQTMEFDLAVLDVMMPDIDGLTLCRKIRNEHTYPIIMLTARDGEMDKITGLTLGADDYITKPFLPGKALVLTPTEFSILRILLENKGSVISAEELFHRIWQDEYYCKANNTIPVHVRHLREKLNDTLHKPMYIKTIWGVGYKIEEA